MAQWRPIPLGDGCYRPRSGRTSIERLRNMYAEPNQPKAASPVTLYGAPGLKAFVTAGDGPCRGLHRDASNLLWVVSGDMLYTVSAGGTVSQIGEIGGTHVCRMIDNRTHTMISTEDILYYADTSGVYQHVTPRGINGLAYQDGYGLLTEFGTQKLYRTNVDDLSTIGALNFTTCDAQPDNVIGCISDEREVCVGKEDTLEFYWNSGASFPFERIPSGFVEVGLAASGALTHADGVIYWLGSDNKIYRARGYQPEPISTPDIERLVRAAHARASCEMWTFSLGGHTWLHVGFHDLTLLYDITTGRWAERFSNGLERWRAQCCATMRNGDVIVGDYANGQLYKLDFDTYNEDGERLDRVIHFPPLTASPMPIDVHAIRLIMDTGVGIASGQGSDPKVELSWSDDDGHSWSNDIEGELGKLGQRRWQCDFRMLGRSESRTFRVRITDPVSVSILSAAAQFELAEW